MLTLGYKSVSVSDNGLSMKSFDISIANSLAGLGRMIAAACSALIASCGSS